jgi:hypothetical protein
MCVYILSSSLDTSRIIIATHTHQLQVIDVSRNQKKALGKKSLTPPIFSTHSNTKSHSSSVCVVYCNHSIERETAHPDPKERKKRQKHHNIYIYNVYIIFLARHTSRIIIASSSHHHRNTHTHTHIISFKSCVNQKKTLGKKSLTPPIFSTQQQQNLTRRLCVVVYCNHSIYIEREIQG